MTAADYLEMAARMRDARRNRLQLARMNRGETRKAWLSLSRHFREAERIAISAATDKLQCAVT